MGAHESYVAVRGENSRKASGCRANGNIRSQATCLPLGQRLGLTSIEISVVPTKADLVAMRYDDAMERVRELARVLAVDGWYTCDHTHFARIASHRN